MNNLKKLGVTALASSLIAVSAQAGEGKTRRPESPWDRCPAIRPVRGPLRDSRVRILRRYWRVLLVCRRLRRVTTGFVRDCHQSVHVTRDRCIRVPRWWAPGGSNPSGVGPA